MFSSTSYLGSDQKPFREIYLACRTIKILTIIAIAVRAVLAKVFSLILLQTLENVLKSNPISVNQIGFKKWRRTADRVWDLY